jgi:hypothetical protein
MHDDTSDAVEYFPAPHSAHELAPVLVPVLVIEPALQMLHSAALELVEYLPLLQAVQFFAPETVPVSVIEPNKHGRQYD